MTIEERLEKVERELAKLRAEVRTRRVIIEDENGVSRAVLDVNEDEPGLKLYDKTYDEKDNEVQGCVRVVLSADVSESGLKLYNGEGNPRAALSVATEPYDEEENGQDSASLKLYGGGGDDEKEEENGEEGNLCATLSVAQNSARLELYGGGGDDEENDPGGGMRSVLLSTGKDGPGLELYTGLYGPAVLYAPPTMVRPNIGNFQGELGVFLREGERLAILSAGSSGMGLIMCDEKGRRIAKTRRA